MSDSIFDRVMRETHGRYIDDAYRFAYNFPLQAGYADLSYFKKAPMLYRVLHDDGRVMSSADTEAEAIKSAEACARQFPGTTFFVTKRVAKSYVAPTPSITTRL